MNKSTIIFHYALLMLLQLSAYNLHSSTFNKNEITCRDPICVQVTGGYQLHSQGYADTAIGAGNDYSGRQTGTGICKWTIYDFVDRFPADCEGGTESGTGTSASGPAPGIQVGTGNCSS